MMDETLNSALAPLRTSQSLRVATWISAIASPFVAAVLMLVSIVWLWMTGRRAAILKAIVARPRPEPLAGIVETGLSFPSGTATIASALFGYLAYLMTRDGSARRNWTVAGLAVVLVALVGFSRMLLSAHYFSDVVAGAILGILCMLASAALGERLGRVANLTQQGSEGGGRCKEC